MNKQLVLAVSIILIAQNSGANEVSNDAYLENDVVKIPVLSTGESAYRLDLQLVPSSNPVQLKMVAAQDITELKLSTTGASTFANNILTIPFLANAKASYKVELKLISAEPDVILELKDASIAAWVNRKAQNEDAITFSNVKSRLADLPDVAWENTQKLLEANKDSSKTADIILKVLKGPNTQLYYDGSERSFEKGIKLWANFSQPREYLALFYNFSDKTWALTQFDLPGLIDAPCTQTECTGGNSGIQTADGLGVGVFGISQKDSIDAYRYGPLQIHEYSHAAQCAPWVGLNNNPCNGQQDMSPCWLTEGQAHFLGISGSFSSFGDYKENRDRQINSHPVESFQDFSAEKILQFYSDDIPRTCIGKANYRLGYTLGMLTVEVLSAIGGSESTMKIYELGGMGQTFEEAFINVYGISWAEAKPILADVIASLHGDVYM
tara:strand:- start:224 stop:1537 length:1314 start_codon:yes stop_codon:yes gene_type:complete